MSEEMAPQGQAAESTGVLGGVSTEAAPAPAAPALFSEGTTFSENWRETLPEALRAEPSLASLNNFESMAKSYVNAQKMIGMDKVVLPNENSPEGIWNEFYSAIGRPETAGDYQFETPEMPEGLQVSEQMLGGFGEQAHKLGLNQQQASELLNWYNQNQVEGYNELQNNQAISQDQAIGELKKEWGMAFDSKVESANAAIRTFDKDGVIESLGLQNNPQIAKLLSTIGESISEDKLVGASKAMAPIDASVEINKIMGDSNHPYYNDEHPEHGDAVKKMQQLFQMANPS